jgi:serine/threonine protein kinase/lipopolysaccharide biosynthesis regulator YciM
MSVTSKSAKEIFLAAVEKATPAERGAFLDQACAGDAALRQRVEALLQAHDEPGSGSEGLSSQTDATDADAPRPHVHVEALAPPPLESSGSCIGPYKLLQQLGEGGMGAVWMAEQQKPVRRKVALKLIKVGMDSRRVVARFEAERQALALMDHPHIAKVLDAGTTANGRPFFVMELVKGVPITRYCDQEHLTLRERLELFIPVCQAVQHAHQKGIIHRDLKPSNVLVALYDGRPAPKVIDFGVAKAMTQKLTERTLFTEVGQIVGTLEYMAPEQAELNNLDIDTRADIYALGAILYELLTGSPPLTRQQLRSAAFTEVLRLIREVEPPRPSTRLSSTAELPNIAAQRKLEPRRLTRLVHGELDWIVMKCLEKDRGRRYETANALALDVQRYLADEPVLAGPPGAGYRLRKFLRRHRGPVVAAALVLLALLAGIVGTSWGLVEAQRQHEQADRERQQAVAQKDRAEAAETLARQRLEDVSQQKQRAEREAAIAGAVNAFLQQDLLGQADIGKQPQLGAAPRNPNITVQELLDRAAQAIEGKFAEQPQTEAAIRLTLGDTYRALGRYAEAQPHLERSVQLRTAQLGANHLDTLHSKHNLAGLYYALGKYDPAEPLYQEVLAGFTAQLGADHPDTLRCKNNLVELYRAQGKYDRSETLFKEVLSTRAAQLGADHPDTLLSKNSLAGLYRAQGKYAEAEPIQQEVVAGFTALLGADHPATLISKHNLAGLYHAQGKFDRAEPLFQQVVAASTAQLGADHPDTLRSKNDLAVLYQDQEKYDRAEPLYKEVLDARTSKLGARHPSTLISKHNLAWLYQAQQKYDQAEPLYQEVLAAFTTQLGADHPNTLYCKNNLANLYQAQGKLDRAEPLFQQVLDARTTKLGADHPDTLFSKNNLAGLYLAQGKFDRAEPLLRDGLAIGAKTHPDAWTTFATQALLGASLLGQQKHADAEPLLLAGYEGLKQRETKIPAYGKVRLTEALERLVQLYDATGQKDKAEEWRKKLEQAKAAAKPQPKP